MENLVRRLFVDADLRDYEALSGALDSFHRVTGFSLIICEAERNKNNVTVFNRVLYRCAWKLTTEEASIMLACGMSLKRFPCAFYLNFEYKKNSDGSGRFVLKDHHANHSHENFTFLGNFEERGRILKEGFKKMHENNIHFPFDLEE